MSRIYGQTNAGAIQKTYANSFVYAAGGKIKSLHLGNGFWETAKFNNWLQITELALGNSLTDTSLWKLNYDYGELDTSGNLNATKNTGNIAKQTISYNGLAAPFVQSYRYDSLDRLIDARENQNGAETWNQQFGYDRFGNRIGFNQTVGGQALTVDNKILPTIDANTNRFNTTDFEYDANGNIIKDANGQRFTFNGDNKQTLVKDSNNTVSGQYFYDGEGKRVKKIVPATGETTIFVYSGSKLVAEYSTQTAQNPTTNYVHTDTLQSVRAVSDAQGNITSRRDFMPFGEELSGANVGRSTGYGTDSLRQKFTGYQKDEETGLDFAEARYYNNQHGRFTAVDPLLASGKSANPQTFNRYAYVMGNPLRLTDPSGMQAGSSPSCSECDGEPLNISTWAYSRNPSFRGTMDTQPSRAGLQAKEAFRLYENSDDRGFEKGFYNALVSVPNFPYDAARIGIPGSGSITPATFGIQRPYEYEQANNFRQGAIMIGTDIFVSNLMFGVAGEAVEGASKVAGVGRAGTSADWMGSSLFRFGDDAATVRNTNNLIPKAGWEDVVIHSHRDGKRLVAGSLFGRPQVMTVEELASGMFSRGYQQGTPVRFICCSAGARPDGPAARLAPILNATVEAPTAPIAVGKEGNFIFPPKSGGKMVSFRP